VLAISLDFHNGQFDKTSSNFVINYLFFSTLTLWCLLAYYNILSGIPPYATFIKP